MKERFKLFTVLISKISRSIRKIKTEEVCEYNLKSTHVSCLYHLYSSKTLTATELCDLCCEDKSSISRSLEFLENNNFLICETTLKKRYNTLFKLTEKGLKIGKIISEKINKILNEASLGLTEENRNIMYKSLTLISNNLQKICNKYNGEIYGN